MADHLSRLKSVPTSLTPVDAYDGGLSSVLRTFAKSLGYDVIDEPLPAYKEYGPRVRGRIYIPKDRVIYVEPTLYPIDYAETLAHELGHHYEWHLCASTNFLLSVVEAEQVVEAVADAILVDYGLNRTLYTIQYIESWLPSPSSPAAESVKNFFEGELDKPFTLVYNRFSSELEEFLSTP